VDELEAVLLGERVRDRLARDPAEADEDLAEPPAELLLLDEGQLELLCGDQTLTEEHRSERKPGGLRRHVPAIGTWRGSLRATAAKAADRPPRPGLAPRNGGAGRSPRRSGRRDRARRRARLARRGSRRHARGVRRSW